VGNSPLSKPDSANLADEVSIADLGESLVAEGGKEGGRDWTGSVMPCMRTSLCR